MKKYFILLIMLIAFQICFSQTYYVDPSNATNYNTIQSAIDDAIHDGGAGTVYVCNPNTNGNPYTYNENLTINFHSNEEIYSISLVKSQSVGQGEIIISSPLATSNVISVTGRFDGVYFLIDGFTICNGYYGIQFTDLYLYSSYINDCIIRNNSGGIFADDSMPNIENCKITDNFFNGFSEAWNSAVVREIGYVKNSEISHNGNDGLNLETNWDILNCTIVHNNGTGLDGYRWFNLRNNIIRDNNQQIILNNYYEVEFSNIEDGFLGTGNIDEDPLFADPLNEDYHLTQLSPCIDAGDPSFPLDPDETIIDMGCYYYEHFYDIKRFDTGVHWTSFPRIELTTNNNSYTDLVDILDHEINPWNDITNIDIYYGSDINPALYFDSQNTPQWSSDPYLARSSNLYKFEILPFDERTLIIDGQRLSETYTLTEPLAAYTKQWLGYWLPESRNMVDAFGDYWEYVEEVWSEDWYYNKCSNNRGIGEPISWSTANKTLEYGKGYIVKFERTSQIEDFHWTPSSTTEEPKKKAESESFTFIEKPDYEVIDVLEIPEDITEIGVYQEEVCVGAVVVENICEQILVYSDNTSREPVPFNFVIVTNGRSVNLPLKNYEVLNQDSGEFEKGYVLSGQQESSIIKFGDIGESQNDLPVIDSVQLHNNYPNPFNPETTLFFSLSTEQEIELTVYNLKGQKVKQLAKGQFPSGKNSVVWNGTDDNGKQVGSGLYLSKLTTSEKTVSKKMLLLK